MRRLAQQGKRHVSRPVGLTQQRHLCLPGGTVALLLIAPSAGHHDVLPLAFASSAARHDVIARRFAAEGFVALAPDLYHGQVVSEPNEARKLVMALDMDAAVGEIQAAIDFLLQQQSVAGSKVGLTGFCMGGRLVLMTALVDDRLGAAVPWYGGPLTAEQAGQVKAPILGLYGERHNLVEGSGQTASIDALAKSGLRSQGARIATAVASALAAIRIGLVNRHAG